MKETFKIQLSQSFQKKTILTLLEDDWLIPRKLRYFLRIKKRVLVNNKAVTFDYLAQPGDNISLLFDSSDFPQMTVSFGHRNLVHALYEDDFLIIVNKPEGMKTHPNQPNEVALQNHVSAYCDQPVFVVHRLDMDTSGAILFAKSQWVLPILNRLLENHHIHREYLALIQGKIKKTSFTINQRIGNDRHNPKKRRVSPSGQAAITHITLLESFPQTCLIKCKLETGRTHQIRVHLSSIGHPIIGDPLYSQDSQESRRLMLHAENLKFIHPLTKEEIFVTAKSRSFTQELDRAKQMLDQFN